MAAPNPAITSMTEKRIFVIAGPNGAGKTTFATEFLPHEARCPVFVNADLIAAGLSPFRPEGVALAAARVMLRRIHEHAARGESFAFETTLSGRAYAASLPRWQRRGYRVTLFFLRLPSPETAIARVRQRVLEGGHDVPDAVIRRRFHAGWRNWEGDYIGECPGGDAGALSVDGALFCNGSVDGRAAGAPAEHGLGEVVRGCVGDAHVLFEFSTGRLVARVVLGVELPRPAAVPCPVGLGVVLLHRFSYDRGGGGRSETGERAKMALSEMRVRVPSAPLNPELRKRTGPRNQPEL